MDTYAPTVEVVRDGSVCTLILRGDLDVLVVSEFLTQAALVIDDRTERLVLDLAGLTFLDCAGARALAIAASFAPGGCPVIIRSVSQVARRTLDLLSQDLGGAALSSAERDSARLRTGTRKHSRQDKRGAARAP